jgi:hypothetical protein
VCVVSTEKVELVADQKSSIFTPTRLGTYLVAAFLRLRLQQKTMIAARKARKEKYSRIALKLGKKDNNDNNNPFRGVHQLLFVLLLIFISYSRPNSSYFPSSFWSKVKKSTKKNLFHI